MKLKIRRILFIFIPMILFSGLAMAQVDLFSDHDLSNIEVEKISDAELAKLWQKGQDYGLSKNDLIQLARSKGLPEREIALLKTRLDTLGSRPTGGMDKLAENTEKRPIIKYDSSSGKIPLNYTNIDSTIFGSELFTSASMAFEPNLRIPAPPNYTLGPDDEIIITVFGLSEKTYRLMVSEQGEIYIPNVGPVLVSSLTLEQATSRIKNKLASTIYTAIKSGATQVQVSLGRIRSIRVTVIGQAKKPGTYTVSSLTTLYNILYLCGGPSNMGSYRNIEVIRGKEKRNADLYDFLVYGDQSGNILLQEGDVVRIPYYKNRVTLSGLVKRPGKYEITSEDDFNSLLEYSGGFQDNAFRGGVSIERVTDTARKIIDLDADKFGSFGLRGSDKIFVRKLQEEYGNRLYITGAIHRPGPYELTPGMTLKNLIEKSGGLKAEAYIGKALIYRYLPNKMPALQSVNLDSVMNSKEILLLQNHDSVVVQSIFSLQDEKKISIQGNVRNPTEISWREGMTLSDALFSANGIGDSGDSSRIEISRRINKLPQGMQNLSESEIINVDLTNLPNGNILLNPNDIVMVKEKAGYAIQRSVYVYGEIVSPGIYALEKNGTRISEIIRNAGGFRTSADSSSLTIKRAKNTLLSDEERSLFFRKVLDVDKDSIQKNITIQQELENSFDLISVDLNHVMNNPQSAENLQLEDGDIITVERAANLVKVSGEVYFPTIVAYKPNKRLKYYLQQAGGLMPQARKSRALVRHPNGKVETVRSFLFIKSYPAVSPRSEIFVPAKDKDNRKKLGATEWAVIVSALGILSNVVINLTK